MSATLAPIKNPASSGRSLAELDLPGEITRRKLVLPVAWDIMVGKPPMASAAEVRPLTVSDSDTLRLADRLRYRREAFGSILQDGKYVRWFDRSVSEILEACAVAGSVSDIEAELAGSDDEASRTDEGPRDIRAVLSAFEAAGLLVRSRRSEPTAAQLNLVEKTTLVDSHLASPLTVEFEITNKCFRHCSYCAYESGPNPRIQTEHELSTDQWCEIIDEFAALGLAGAEFTGGDPFVRPDALEIIGYADSKGIGLTINSDLSVLKDSHLEGLASLKHLIAIQTSLDGATAESCDLTRGPGGFKTLMKQLERLCEAGLVVSVGTTVHRKNFSEVGAIARLAAERGATGYYVGPMYPAGRGAALTSLVVEPAEWDIAIDQYMTVLRDGTIAATDAFWYEILKQTQSGENPARNQVYITSRGDRSLRIDPLGSAYVTAKLRQWHPRFWSVGSLREFSINTIWNDSLLLNELRSYPISEANPFGGLDVRTIPAAESSDDERADRTGLALINS